MKNPKVLTISDIVGGKFYICMVVASNNQMRIEINRFFGVVQKAPSVIGGGQWYRTSRNNQNKPKKVSKFSSFGGYNSVSDFGLNPKLLYNEHRVFEFNTDNMRILKDLVARQDLVAYLTLIGEHDPEGVVRKRQLLLQKEMGEEDDPFDMYSLED